MAAPEPIASGTLTKTPLPHLFLYLEQKQLSGTLALWPDETEGASGQDRILLLKGRPVAGRLMQPASTLKDGLLALFTRGRAPYAFYESNLLGDERQNGRIDPVALVTEAMRSCAQPSTVAQVLARFEGKRLRLLPGVNLERYGFDSDERAIVQIIQAEPSDIDTLMQLSGLGEQRTRALLYTLGITKAIAAADDAQAGEAAKASAQRDSRERAAKQQAASEQKEGGLHGDLARLANIPPPPDELSDELRERWLRVVTKGRLIENQNYFEMLDIPRNAKASDARTKYYQLAKEWHPDRLPKELSPIKEYVQIIFSYLSEANATLSDEEARVKYVQTVREGGGTPAADKLIESILNMAMEYEKVLVFSRRRQFDEAIGLMERILSVIKDQAEYHAMYAWLLVQKYPHDDGPMKQMMAATDAALALHADHERANMLKAQLLRRQGDTKEALRYFKKVASLNPHNIEAVREVRVATMRQQAVGGSTKGKGGGTGKKAEEAGVGGLLGKLFKKR
ncbi:MAG: DnaJ domain-containing protein [Myxococcales bacterium]|nr:DnaJ domain-containing protein [Myxococcales bacterium]